MSAAYTEKESHVTGFVFTGKGINEVKDREVRKRIKEIKESRNNVSKESNSGNSEKLK